MHTKCRHQIEWNLFSKKEYLSPPLLLVYFSLQNNKKERERKREKEYMFLPY